MPKGFVALPGPVSITVGEDGTVTLGGEGADLCVVESHAEEDADMLATITVKNRRGSFQIMKIDTDLQAPLSGVTFALYRQVIDAATGKPMRDYHPISGFEAIVIDENGVLTGIDGTLPALTYYLSETGAAEDYDLLTEDLCFTMGKDGTVTINNPDPTKWRLKSTPGASEMSYLIEVLNSKQKVVSFKKVDVENPESVTLQGAVFDLYRVVDGVQETVPMIKGLVSDRNGMLVSGGWDKFRLAAGTYHLIETQAPEGYILKTDPVVITVNAEGVTYDEQTALGSNGRGVTYEENVYLLLISNSRGFELPSTGSSETIVRAFIGASLVLVSAVMLFQHRRKLMDER